MTELTGADVATYTNDRLDGDDDNIKLMLSAALQVARARVGWHVSPVKVNHAMTLDGPNSRILWLPTMKVVEVTSVEEDGNVLDVANISVSVGDGPHQRRRQALRKRGRGWWTAEYGAIELVMTHGFTEVEAADWRNAIMQMVDTMSTMPVVAATGASAFGATALRVDDVSVNFTNPYLSAAEEVAFSYGAILSSYKLGDVEFY